MIVGLSFFLIPICIYNVNLKKGESFSHLDVISSSRKQHFQTTAKTIFKVLYPYQEIYFGTLFSQIPLEKPKYPSPSFLSTPQIEI